MTTKVLLLSVVACASPVFAQTPATLNADKYRQSVETEWAGFQNIVPVVRTKSGETKWNDYLERLKNNIRGINPASLSEAQIAQMAVRSALMPEILKAMDAYKQRADALAAENARLKGQVSQMPKAPNSIPVQVPRIPRPYAVQGNGKQWIKKVMDRGAIIQLDDDSLWKVDEFDRIDSMLWLPLDDVMLMENDGKLLNMDDKHSVSVTRLR